MNHANTQITSAQRKMMEQFESERIPAHLWENTFWGTSEHKSVKSTPFVLEQIDRMIDNIKGDIGEPTFNFSLYQSIKHLRVTVQRNISNPFNLPTGKCPPPPKQNPTVIEAITEIGYDKICAVTMLGAGVIFYHDEFVHNLKMSDVIRESIRVYTEDMKEDCTSCPACEHCPICAVER